MKISELIVQYVGQSHDSVEAEEDSVWTNEDLVALREAVSRELTKRFFHGR